MNVPWWLGGRASAGVLGRVEWTAYVPRPSRGAARERAGRDRRAVEPAVHDRADDAGHVALLRQRARPAAAEAAGPSRVHLRQPLRPLLRRDAIGGPGRVP